MVNHAKKKTLEKGAPTRLHEIPTFGAIVVLEGVVALLRLELLEIRVD